MLEAYGGTLVKGAYCVSLEDEFEAYVIKFQEIMYGRHNKLRKTSKTSLNL